MDGGNESTSPPDPEEGLAAVAAAMADIRWPTHLSTGGATRKADSGAPYCPLLPALLRWVDLLVGRLMISLINVGKRW